MEISKTDIEGVLIIEPRLFRDAGASFPVPTLYTEQVGALCCDVERL